MRVFDIGAKDGPREVSHRILTLPNLLSLARIVVLPLIYFDLVDGRLVRALTLTVVFASTDWLDGYFARRLDQVTRLGQLLDPISDRLLFVVVGVGLVVVGLLPLAALVLLVVRDVVVMGVGGALLATGSRPPPVTRIGKTATFGLMSAFPAFLIAAIVGEGVRDPQPVIHAIAWIAFIIHITLYYVAAVGYGRTVVRQLRLGSSSSPRTGE